jgi:hypothetical protein
LAGGWTPTSIYCIKLTYIQPPSPPNTHAHARPPSIALEWEQKWFSNGAHREGLLAQDFPDESVQELADTLCRRARELSLDQKRDSPFAILAKENDIMWGGGMPDDCTVVAIRVVKDGNGGGNKGQG